MFTTPVSFLRAQYIFGVVLTLGVEYAFIAGMTMLGFICIGAGFVRNKIILIVLRALSGIGTLLSLV